MSVPFGERPGSRGRTLSLSIEAWLLRDLVVRSSGVLSRVKKLAPGLIGLVLPVIFFLVPAPLHGDEHGTTITGQVVNGTSGGEAPANLEVALHTLGGSEVVDVTTALTDGEGHFEFQNVEPNSGLTYALTTTYQDVQYSRRLDPPPLAEPVELTVYEATSSLGEIHVGADVLLIREAGEDKKSLLAFEVVSLVNEGDRSFVPDLVRPESMSFLRFSVPAGATDPEVSSDIPGGQVINVPTGFALIGPVTPGSHQVTYTYRLPYNGSQIDVNRSFPMGAKTFRLLLEEELGNVKGSDLLTSHPPMGMGGKSYEVWGVDELSPAARLNVVITDLPQPPLLNRLGDSLTDGPYLKIGLPATVGLALATLLLYVLLFRQPARAHNASPGPWAAADDTLVDDPGQPGGPLKDERGSLVDAIARLDDRFQSGDVSQEEHQGRRQELKERLLQLARTSEAK